MRIDYSQAAAWFNCPAEWQEKYQKKRAVDWDAKTGGIGFGKRMHQLLEIRYKSLLGLPLPEYPPSINAETEEEAQAMLAAYGLEYPATELVGKNGEVERLFEVPLSPASCSNCGLRYESFDSQTGVFVRYATLSRGMIICEDCQHPTRAVHTYCGKVDLWQWDAPTAKLTDHKTEERGGRGNTLEHWAVAPQLGLYKWALEPELELPTVMEVNVLTRRSPAGQIGPSFRRFEVVQTPEFIEGAVEDLRWVADQISASVEMMGEEPFPRNRGRCIVWGKKCPYYDLHLIGETPELLSKFIPQEDYLGQDT